MVKSVVIFLILFSAFAATCTASFNDVAESYNNYFGYCMNQCSDGNSFKSVDDCKVKCTETMRPMIHDIAREAKEKNMKAMSDESEDEVSVAVAGLFSEFQKQLKLILTKNNQNPGFQLQAVSLDLLRDDENNFDDAVNFSKEMNSVSNSTKFRGQRSGSARWSDEFKNFLSGVKGNADGMGDDEENKLLSELTDALKKQRIATMKCDDQYEKDKKYFGDMSKEQYRDTFCKDVDAYKQKVTAKQGQLRRRYRNSPKKFAELSLGKVYQFEKNNKVFFEKVGLFKNQKDECLNAEKENRKIKGTYKKISFESNINKFKREYKVHKSVYTVRHKVRYGIFFHKTKYERRVRKELKVKNFNMQDTKKVDIEFQDVQYYPVYPTEWYNSGAISLLRDAPRTEGSDIKHFFGTEQSSLSLMPKGVHVAIKPKITLTLKINDGAEKIRDELHRASSKEELSVLGMNFGSKPKIVTGKDPTTGGATVEIESSSCSPQLIAVENNVHY